MPANSICTLNAYQKISYRTLITLALTTAPAHVTSLLKWQLLSSVSAFPLPPKHEEIPHDIQMTVKVTLSLDTVTKLLLSSISLIMGSLKPSSICCEFLRNTFSWSPPLGALPPTHNSWPTVGSFAGLCWPSNLAHFVWLKSSLSSFPPRRSPKAPLGAAHFTES